MSIWLSSTMLRSEQRPRSPRSSCPSDPAACWTAAHGGQAFFTYSTNYLVDVENAIIVDVEATTAIRQAVVLAAKLHDRVLARTVRPLSKPIFAPQVSMLP